MSRVTTGIVLLAIAASVACDDLVDVELPESFGAVLKGDREVPPVDTDATGLATFRWDGTTMRYEIAVNDLDDTTVAHIHEGEAGVNGGVLVTLFPGPTVEGEFSGLLVQDQFTAPDEGADLTMDELVDRMRSGDVYVNVHTAANPGGEIRGQIQRVTEGT